MARPQNIILNDIVVATGGTVTDPNNRNSLLQDWLDSLAARLVYDLDGIDDYISIPTVNLVSGDAVEFKYRGSQQLINQYFIDTRISGSGQFLIINAAGATQLSGLTLNVDGNSVGNGDPWTFDDGIEHDVMITSTVSSSLVKLFVKDIAPLAGYLTGEVYDISITAVSGNRFYPVNDGFPVNPLIADTLGGQDGAAMNFNESRWLTINV